MVKQTITYSDGSETVINYRGVIENGVVIPDAPEVVEEKIETPKVEESTAE